MAIKLSNAPPHKFTPPDFAPTPSYQHHRTTEHTIQITKKKGYIRRILSPELIFKQVTCPPPKSQPQPNARQISA